MRRLAIGFAIALTLASLGDTRTATAAPSLRLTRISNLADATAMTPRPGTRTLYVTEQHGRVRSIRDGTLADAPVIDLTQRVSQDGGERGLLGLAFSPDATHLYVNYTDRNGDTQIDEFEMRGRVADPATRRNLLMVEQPEPNHNGGQLAFGPDGDLYIGLGDGGAQGDQGPGHVHGGNGQSLTTLLGKILRIDPRPSNGLPYTIPADNPFVGHPEARPEIWAYGLRNPWRFSFDRATGDLWIGDVGQSQWEEIDHVPATNGRDAGKGDNFGWDRVEGTHRYTGDPPPGAIPPVYEFSHAAGNCAGIGGYVYRGTKIAGLAGSYFFSDNCDSTIRLLVPDGNGGLTLTDSGLSSKLISSFGEANNGTLYVLSLANGVFRIDPARNQREGVTPSA